MLVGQVLRNHAAWRATACQAVGHLTGCSSSTPQCDGARQWPDMVASTSGRSRPSCQPHAHVSSISTLAYAHASSSRTISSWAPGDTFSSDSLTITSWGTAWGLLAGGNTLSPSNTPSTPRPPALCQAYAHASSISTISSWGTPGTSISRGFASEAPQPAAQEPPPKLEAVEFQVGHVYSAVVKEAQPVVLHLKLQPKGPRVSLRAGDLSSQNTGDLTKLFRAGERIKVIVCGTSPKGALYVSTRLLEPEPGAMLRDKKAVFAAAEQQAITVRAALAERFASRKQLVNKYKAGDTVQAVVLSMRTKARQLLARVEGHTVSVPGTRLGLPEADWGLLEHGATIELHVLESPPNHSTLRLGAPPGTRPRITPAPPTAASNTPAQPTAEGITPAPPTTDSSILAQPTAEGITPAPPTAASNTPAQPTAADITPVPPAADSTIPGQPTVGTPQ